ncbi:MAG: hypothetical protein ACFFA6_09960 [Promethearchaeota archaeon]
MKKVNVFFDKLYKRVPGYVFGLLAFILGFLGTLLALLLSPEYVMWEKSISVLGHKTGGLYLRVGLILFSITSIPFLIYFARTLRNEEINEYLRRGGFYISIFSSITTILTESFTGVNEFISALHGLFALWSWMGGAMFLTLFSIVMKKNPNFSKLQIYVSFIVTGIFIFYLIPFFITNFCSYFPDLCYSFGRAVYIIMPTTEWFVHFSILFWVLFNSIYFLYKKVNYD